ncbi:MAG: hypothetical protein EOS38_18455 [Mesorhizobium sp.]|nr:hypothetical protein EOA38_23210 [Mesorhizobium sp. M1E.F.Ca.ET.041.01.1.1]RUW81774.1 hypothetical protein EOA29_20280 [Mesorhizobium sp. M1E.F.Ca.ET.063.01.1.1]RWD87179.1 MAG: hypothetical protein EOS38_18455 [Mesorhizobium sp.]
MLDGARPWKPPVLNAQRDRPRFFQHPSSVSALRADPPSPTRGEGKALMRSETTFIVNSPPAAAARDSRWSNGRAPGSGRPPP